MRAGALISSGNGELPALPNESREYPEVLNEVMMEQLGDQRPGIAVAGDGDMAKFLVDELLRDGRYRVIVLTRSVRPCCPFAFLEKNPENGQLNVNQIRCREWYIRHGVDVHRTDYSHPSILSVLNAASPIALFSFIHSDEPAFYLGVHDALLSACSASNTCRRLIPSEYGGNITAFPKLPLFFASTHGEFRKKLRAQTAVKWALVSQGWFMDYFVEPKRSVISPSRGLWPIDLARSRVFESGAPEELIGWTAARDVAKALVRLVEVDDLEEHIYILGEQTTWNAAINKLEIFHNRRFTRVNTTQEIETWPSGDNLFYTSEMGNSNVIGAGAVPWNEVVRHREKYFEGIKFRNIDELLRDTAESDI